MTVDEIKEATILRMQPGDAVVLKLGRDLSQDQVARLKASWQASFRGTAVADAPLVILAPGTDISILRRGGELTPEDEA